MEIPELHQLEVNSKIVDEITFSALENELRGIGPNEIRYLWTPTELELMEEYVPSTYHKLAEKLDLPMNTPGFLERLAFQLQSEIINKSATIDAGIISGRHDAGSVSSKIYNLMRLNSILQRISHDPEHNVDWRPDPLPENVLKGNDLIDILIQTKLRFTDMLRVLPEWADKVPVVTKTDKDLTKEEKSQFDYVKNIMRLAGNNAVAMALYGSAAKEKDPKNFGDYDNFLVIKEGCLKHVYPRLRDKRFMHRDGKHIGLNLVEDTAFTKMIRMNHDSNEYLRFCKVLHGSLDFPISSEEEIQERGTSYAIIRARSLKSACSWIARKPELLLGKEELFEYFQKTPLFILHTALNATEGVADRKKEDFKAKLAELDGEVLPYRKDAKYLTEATYKATILASRILHKYYAGKKFADCYPVTPSVRPNKFGVEITQLIL